MAGTKFTDLSLQITPYKEDGKKKSALKFMKKSSQFLNFLNQYYPIRLIRHLTKYLQENAKLWN
jgi:hypothetical protein